MKTNSSNVEFMANRFAIILKYMGLTVGITLICYSLYLLFWSHDEFTMTPLLYGIISIVVALLIYHILTLLINISLTLNMIYTKADKFTHDKLLGAIERISEEIKRYPTPSKPTQSKPVATKVERPSEEICQEVEPLEIDVIAPSDSSHSDVISLIKKGHIHMARHILITEKNMSLSRADSYINSIRL